MKDLKDSLNEQLNNVNEGAIRGDGHISKHKEGNTEIAIVEDTGAKYLYTMYDEDSGEMDIIATDDIVEYLMGLWGMPAGAANKIGNLKTGESYVDPSSNELYVRLK